MKDRPEAPVPTRKCFNNTLCVRVMHTDMTWAFSTGVPGANVGFAWRYVENKRNGMNLGLHQPDGSYSFQLNAKSLEDAVVYATGFTYGWFAKLKDKEEDK